MSIFLGLGIAFIVMVLSTITCRLLFKTWYPLGTGHLILCYLPFVVVVFAGLQFIPATLGIVLMDIPLPVKFLLDINPFALWVPIVLYALPATIIIVG